MELLPNEMKTEPDENGGDDTAVPAVQQTAKIQAAVRNSNEAIRKMAQTLAAKRDKKSFNALARKTAQGKPVETYDLFEGELQNDSRTHQILTPRDILERNKSYGLYPTDIFTRHGIDYDTFWQQNIMDKFYPEHRDKDGKWVGGYINNRFEVDRNVPDANNMQLKPGERRKPILPEYGIMESRLQVGRGEKPFNWMTAKASGTTKIAGKCCSKCGMAMIAGMDGSQCPSCKKDKEKEAKDKEAMATVVNSPAFRAFQERMKLSKTNRTKVAIGHQERYDFARGEARAKAMTDEMLKWNIKDLKETIQNQEEMHKAGYDTPKLGYYWDEYHTFVGEIHKRQTGGSQGPEMRPKAKDLTQKPELSPTTPPAMAAPTTPPPSGQTSLMASAQKKK